jgi:hypothetical protein
LRREVRTEEGLGLVRELQLQIVPVKHLPRVGLGSVRLGNSTLLPLSGAAAHQRAELS